MSDENDCYDYGDPKRSDYHEHPVPALDSLALDVHDWATPPKPKWWQQKTPRTIAQALAWGIIALAVMVIVWLGVVVFATAGGAHWALTEEPVVPVSTTVHPPCLPQYPSCNQADSPWRVHP